MATLTFSFDFFENAITGHLLMLYHLCNDCHCTHRVAVDKDVKLPELYEKRCKYGDLLSSWVGFVTDGLCKFTKAPFSIDPNNVQDMDILDMTFSLVGERMMVVDSLQSTSSYVKQSEIGFDKSVRIVDCKYADDFIHGRPIVQQMLIDHSIVAGVGATVRQAKVMS
jgi:hypothetical protein